MKVVTAEEMRFIDKKTIDEYGIPGAVLMERAGLAVTLRIKELFGRKRVIVVSGSGNNGGDGLVIARTLHKEGWDVRVFLSAKSEDLKGDALLQYKTAVAFGVKVEPLEKFLSHHSAIITKHSLFVDALFGTGLSKNVTGIFLDVIKLLNNSGMPVVSVDIPSGISSDNGQIMGEAVRADYTITFGLPKRGHLVYPGAGYSGKLFIEDIGFPEELLKSEKIKTELLTKKEVSPLLPRRQKYSHKGHYGHVLIVAGSRGKTGAALMSAKACLRAGSGLVTIGIPESLSNIFQSRVTEEMTLILPDKGDGTLSAKAAKVILKFLEESADVLAIGPGIGVSNDTRNLVLHLIKNSPSPMVIDADGLNCLKGETEILSKTKVPLILTPHPGEMARLLSQSGKTVTVPDIENDRITVALSFVKKTGISLVLKGVPTIIAGPDGRVYISSTGNPGMATAGTGDVLTGMIAGFLGLGIQPIHASILGVYMHGLAGEMASSDKGEYSLIATDIIDKIPVAFHSLYHE